MKTCSSHRFPLFSSIVFIALSSTFSFTTALARPTQQQQIWTSEQILTERDLTTPDKKRPRYCQGGAFKPCVCAPDVTKAVQYRPSVQECKGNAAIILSKRYTSSYSAVVRDKENKDRWPLKGINKCTPYERDTLGLNKCSAFKVQRVISQNDSEADAEIHCLGASGYSPTFRRVSRITIKLQDIPDSNKDPLARLCLNGPTQPLN